MYLWAARGREEKWNFTVAHLPDGRWRAVRITWSFADCARPASWPAYVVRAKKRACQTIDDVVTWFRSCYNGSHKCRNQTAVSFSDEHNNSPGKAGVGPFLILAPLPLPLSRHHIKLVQSPPIILFAIWGYVVSAAGNLKKTRPVRMLCKGVCISS